MDAVLRKINPEFGTTNYAVGLNLHSLEKQDLQILFLCVFFAHMYVCTPCSPTGAHRGQKVWDPLELKFQMVVNLCVATESRTQVLWKSERCSLPRSQPNVGSFTFIF